jgi:hypothetical protein
MILRLAERALHPFSWRQRQLLGAGFFPMPELSTLSATPSRRTAISWVILGLAELADHSWAPVAFVSTRRTHDTEAILDSDPGVVPAKISCISYVLFCATDGFTWLPEIFSPRLLRKSGFPIDSE